MGRSTHHLHEAVGENAAESGRHGANQVEEGVAPVEAVAGVPRRDEVDAAGVEEGLEGAKEEPQRNHGGPQGWEAVAYLQARCSPPRSDSVRRPRGVAAEADWGPHHDDTPEEADAGEEGPGADHSQHHRGWWLEDDVGDEEEESEDGLSSWAVAPCVSPGTLSSERE